MANGSWLSLLPSPKLDDKWKSLPHSPQFLQFRKMIPGETTVVYLTPGDISIRGAGWGTNSRLLIEVKQSQPPDIKYLLRTHGSVGNLHIVETI